MNKAATMTIGVFRSERKLSVNSFAWLNPSQELRYGYTYDATPASLESQLTYVCPPLSRIYSDFGPNNV